MSIKLLVQGKDDLPTAEKSGAKVTQTGQTLDALIANPYLSDQLSSEERNLYRQRFSFKYGQHEPLDFWLDCRKRSRNKGLYTAEENLKDDIGATSTRQDRNNNGDRYGLECPEERDYYPYWHPTPWHDVAVFTSEPRHRCNYFQEHSSNVEAKNYCTGGEACVQYNNEDDCLRLGVLSKDTTNINFLRKLNRSQKSDLAF